MSVAAVVTAAGSGSRLGADAPKALVRFSGRALVAWAVLGVADSCDQIVVTAPASHLGEVEAALADVRDLVGRPMLVIPGGAERQQSVAAAIDALFAPTHTPPDIILVHDAARAFQEPAVTRAAIAAVRAGADGAIPILPLVDTLVAATATRAVGGYGLLGETVDRDQLRAVQTPQVFRAAALREAHATHADARATDDAQLVRASAGVVVAVDGHESGVKVTRPSDLPVAEHYAAQLRAAELADKEQS